MDDDRMWKRYPRYKPTGINWIGEVPSHWDTRQLKHLARLVTGGTPPRSDEDNYGSRGIPWVKPNDLAGLEPILSSEEYLSGTAEKYVEVVPSGSALVCCIGSIGKVGVAGTALATNQQINAVVFDNGSHWLPQYAYYALLASEQEHQRSATVTVVSILNRSSQSRIRFPVPTLAEQRLIAAFLDRETARIDTLIAKKERLIELLQEKRTALISHAVTKGLDPDVEMKDSGIKAVGAIPAHWRVERNKRIFREVDERSKEGQEELLSVSHITGVTPRSEKEVNMFMAESLDGYKLCRVNDLVINTMWAWMGALGISRYEGIASPSYNVYRLRRPLEYTPRYLDLLYRTPEYISEIGRYSKGVWSSRLRLYPREFFDINTLTPPVEEQERIVKHLVQELAKIESFEHKLQASIKKLGEYRIALISATVTGKIDVR